MNLICIAASLMIATRGQPPDCTIVVSGGETASVRYAAEELRDWTEKLTDVRLPVSAKSTTAKAIRVELGSDANLGDDGFRLRCDGNVLTVSGGKRGVLYGVYELLEKYGGIGWYSADTTVVPNLDAFAVPADINVSQKPAFALRDTSWAGMVSDADFAARSRLNVFRSKPQAKHGGFGYRFVKAFGSCHSFQRLIPREKYFADHPEYFSEIGGVRVDAFSQLCLTNPEVLRIVAARIREELAKDPDVDVVNVSQNDNRLHCQCSVCSAVNEEAGSASGTLVQFLNALAEELGRTHPNLLIDTFAYQATRKPPKNGMKLHPNIVPCVCTYEADWASPIGERRCPANASFDDDLKGWSSIARQIRVWDYTTNFSSYLHAMPDVHVLQPNLRYFRDRGARYVIEEGGAWHADFAELKAWLIAKLMWNPDADVPRLLDRFFAGYYGAAAAFARDYFERVEDIVRKNPSARMGIWDHDKPAEYTDEFLAWARANWKRAEGAVADDPQRLYNVRMSEMVAVSMAVDRAAMNAKLHWATRRPELVKPIDPTVISDVDWLFERLDEAKDKGRNVRICSVRSRDADRRRLWRRLASLKRPDAGSDSAFVAAEDLQFDVRSGKLVEDASATSGKALDITLRQGRGNLVTYDFSHVAMDGDADYVVKVHVKMPCGNAAVGEAFRVGLANDPYSNNSAERAVRADEVGDVYAWYDIGTVKYRDGHFWLKAGNLRNGGQNAIKSIRLDGIEISRK